MHHIDTERLHLRPFTEGDVAAFFALGSDPEVIRFVSPNPLVSLAQAEAMLHAAPLHDYARYGYGRLAVVEKGGSEVIGFCGLKYLPDLAEIDLGYRFLPSHWGKGYASESALAVLDHARTVLGLARIIGLADPANTASTKVLRKLGMRFERLIDLPPYPVPIELYACDAG